MSVETEARTSETAEIRRLEGLGGEDPAGPTIAAFAEAHRRAGEPDKALALAEEGLSSQPELVAARVARALALLDLERPGEAQAELEAILDLVSDHPLARGLEQAVRAASGTEALAPLDHAELDESELDQAFGSAQPETDQMVSANDFAEAAIHAVEEQPDASDDLTPVVDDALEPSFEGERALPLDAESPFATETVAGLLADQGHDEEARELRSSFAPADADVPEEDLSGEARSASEGRLLTTLERWLDNLRKRTR